MTRLSRMMAAGALAASAALAAEHAAAEPVQIDFTVDYAVASVTIGSTVAPFGTPPHNSTSPYPTFSGSFVFDDTGLGPNSSVLFSDHVTSLSFQTGSVSWNLADIAVPPSSTINNLEFDAAGLLDMFRFEIRTPGLGSVIVTSDNSMNLRTWDLELSSACNLCVRFEVGTPGPGPDPDPDPTPIPLPASLPLMATGLGLMGLAGRPGRRRTGGT